MKGKAKDKVYGRQGGRVLDAKPQAGTVCRARCGCGRWVVVVSDLGRACDRCAGVLEQLGEPWHTTGELELPAVDVPAPEPVVAPPPGELAAARAMLAR